MKIQDALNTFYQTMQLHKSEWPDWVAEIKRCLTVGDYPDPLVWADWVIDTHEELHYRSINSLSLSDEL